jgi:peptide/nickel transport system substrate-binding protein
MALNFSTPSFDVSMMARFFSAAYFSPNDLNFGHWRDDQFEGALAALAMITALSFRPLKRSFLRATTLD